MIVLDSRERDLIAHLQSKHPKFAFKVATLAVGDIELRDDDGTPRLTLERKTWADLEASIIDKRWHEQGHRLKQLGHRWMYVLEGRLGKPRLHPNALRGAILNAQIRDGSQFIVMKNLADTAKLCTELHRRFHSTKKGTGLSAPKLSVPEAGAEASAEASAEAGVSKSKRMRESDTILQRQLMCIPKVSEPIARLLTDTFITRDALRNAVNADLGAIADLKYNNRRLGKIAEHIKNNI